MDIFCLQMQMIGVGKCAGCFGRSPAMPHPFTNEVLSFVCKCGLLGLAGAQQRNKQIYISTVRRCRQILDGLTCCMRMLECPVIEMAFLTEEDDWSWSF
jgi:hypothetical protein